MKIKNMKLVGVVMALSIITGCGTGSNTTSNEEIRTLTIAQMPDESNPEAGTKNKEFSSDMAKSLGIEIKEFEGAEYSVGIEAMKAGKLDIMLVTPMSYYQAKQVADVEPLVSTTSMGAAEYKTVFIVGKNDTTTKTLADLKGKSFAFVDPSSSSGYMYPKAKLVEDLNLDTDTLENPGYFFSTVAYSGKHDSSIMGVVKGDYEAAAVANQMIDPLVASGMIKKDDIRIIGETDVIPNACYIMRADLPEAMKQKIKDFYLGYKNASYFETFYGSGDVRFIEVKDEDYAIVESMVKVLHMEEQ